MGYDIHARNKYMNSIENREKLGKKAKNIYTF